MDKQEYMHNSEYVTIAYQVQDNPDLVVVVNYDGQYDLARKGSLQKKEDTWSYKRQLEREDELRVRTAKIQENLDAVASKVVDKALKDLASRIKFNVAFGEGGSSGAYALMLSEQLTKMIKESGEKMKNKDKVLDF